MRGRQTNICAYTRRHSPEGHEKALRDSLSHYKSQVMLQRAKEPTAMGLSTDISGLKGYTQAFAGGQGFANAIVSCLPHGQAKPFIKAMTPKGRSNKRAAIRPYKRLDDISVLVIAAFNVASTSPWSCWFR